MKVLFVCTGNTCRSPMAEAFAHDAFIRSKLPIEVSSYGISVIPDSSASPNAILAMREYGMDISAHHSRMINKESIEEADLVLGMTALQCESLQSKFGPRIRGKVFTISQYINGQNKDIADPYGGDLHTYKRCAAEIKKLIDQMAVNERNNMLES